MKEIIGIVAIVIAVVLVIVGFIVGMYALSTYFDERYEREAKEGCSKVAELSDIKEWQVDGSYNCVFVKDGKLQTVKDW